MIYPHRSKAIRSSGNRDFAMRDGRDQASTAVTVGLRLEPSELSENEAVDDTIAGLGHG